MAEVKEGTFIDLSEESEKSSSTLNTGLQRISDVLTAMICLTVVVNFFFQWGNHRFTITEAIVISVLILSAVTYFILFAIPRHDFFLTALDSICFFKKADGKIQLRSNSRISVEKMGPTLRWGYVYFKYPPFTVVGASERAVAEVAFKKNLFELNDEALVEAAEISTVLTVKLITSDFEVQALNTETQMILPDKKTTWQWNIKALKTGKRKLTLNVSAQLKTSDNEAPYDVTTLERTIEVKVSGVYVLKSFWLKNYQWIIGALTGTGAIFSILKLFGMGSK